jgi:hypothetical protein
LTQIESADPVNTVNYAEDLRFAGGLYFVNTPKRERRGEGGACGNGASQRCRMRVLEGGGRGRLEAQQRGAKGR